MRQRHSKEMTWESECRASVPPHHRMASVAHSLHSLSEHTQIKMDDMLSLPSLADKNKPKYPRYEHLVLVMLLSF